MPRSDPNRASLALTVLLVALVAFAPMSMDIYLPALPEMMRALSVDVSGAQITLSAFTGTLALAQLFYGPLSDRFGRRPLLLAGIGIYLAATLLCLTARTIDTLVAYRVLQAAGGCAGAVLARAAVRDMYGREQAARMMSLLSAAMSIAPAVAPVVGGWLVPLGWQANFVVMAGFGAAVLAGTWLLMHETNKHMDPEALNPWRMVETFTLLTRDRIFVGNGLAVTFAFVSLYAFVSISSFVVIGVLGVRPDHFGYCFAAPVLCFMVSSTIASRIAHRVPIERTIRVGVAIGVLGGLVMLILSLSGVQTVAAVIVPAAAMAFAQGLVLPNSSAVALSGHPRIAGSASALMGMVQAGLGAIAGWLAGLLQHGTTLTLAAFMAGGWVVVALIHLTLLRRPGPSAFA